MNMTKRKGIEVRSLGLQGFPMSQDHIAYMIYSNAKQKVNDKNNIYID